MSITFYDRNTPEDYVSVMNTGTSIVVSGYEDMANSLTDIILSPERAEQMGRVLLAKAQEARLSTVPDNLVDAFQKAWNDMDQAQKDGIVETTPGNRTRAGLAAVRALADGLGF